MPKSTPPVAIARPSVINNRRILAARLRSIATLVLKGKTKQAWHALIALADKVDPEK